MREKFRRGCAFSMVGACKAEPQYPAMSQRRVAERMHRVGGGGEEGKQEELRISIRFDGSPGDSKSTQAEGFETNKFN